MKDKHNATLKGIVVAGDSREQAENNYRAVATGVSCKALQDEDNSFIILSNADTELNLMNPVSGDMNLVEAQSTVTEQLEFLASDSDDQVETFYTVCSDGCGSHVIADDASIMEHCPVCASVLQDLSEEEIASLSSDDIETDTEIEANASSEEEADAIEDEEDLEANASADSDDADAIEDEEDLEAEASADSDEDEEDLEAEASAEDDEGDDIEDDSILAMASTLEDASAKFKDLVSGKVSSTVMDCGTGIIAIASAEEESGEFNYSPYTGEASSKKEGEFTATASDVDLDQIEANWYICASDECGKHVVCSSDTPVFCPSCSSGLIEPDEDSEALASVGMDDSEEDLEAEASADEDLDLEIIASHGNDDEDDCEEDEDEDEEEEDEDEDIDDDNTLSISTASDSEEDSSDTENAELSSVNVNLVSMASAEGELQSGNLAVSKIGAINNESMWMAFYNGSPIATATASSNAADDTVFESEVFGNLLLASAQENGVESALNELGFIPIVATASVDDYVLNEINDQVDSRLESVSGEYKQASADHGDRFAAALATAASGINKNFFEDVTNPVKGALVSTLASLNIRNPEKLVATAFAEHNDTYLKNLMSKTQDIMDYDLEVQNQLTTAIAGASKELEATASDSPISIGKPVEVETEQPQPVVEATASSSTKPSLDTVLSTLRKH